MITNNIQQNVKNSKCWPSSTPVVCPQEPEQEATEAEESKEEQFTNEGVPIGQSQYNEHCHSTDDCSCLENLECVRTHCKMF